MQKYTYKLVCVRLVFRRSENPQSDGVPAGAAPGAPGDGGPHDAAAELLHQAKGPAATRPVHHGQTTRYVHSVIATY